ncbi:MAG: hypothetical protein KDB74_10105 [Flavobacteriales bacterium]|nr:hypothetical protein [Flavobacteriales bacterium]
MKKYIRYFILLAFLVFLNHALNAQIYDIGVFGGVSYNKLIPEKNTISNTLFIRDGIGKPGVFIGMNYAIGPPKDQPKKGLDIKSKLLVEASYGKGGSYMTFTYSNPNGNKKTTEIEYTFYRGDYSAKLALGLKKFQFVIGPTVTNIFYSGMDISGVDKTRSATGDFASISIGYELGVGIEGDAANISLRYQRNASDFGQRFMATPAKINNYQIRLMLAYRIYRKHNGINRRSINWHK